MIKTNNDQENYLRMVHLNKIYKYMLLLEYYHFDRFLWKQNLIYSIR